MATEKVYYFKKFDINTYDYAISRGPATREAITTRQCLVIEETETEIDSRLLDADGMVKAS